MNNVIKVKYKLHRFVNLAFYFVFFLIGFLIGGGSLEKVIHIFTSIF